MKFTIEVQENHWRCGEQDPIKFHNNVKVDSWRARLNRVKGVAVVCFAVRKPGGKGVLPIIDVMTNNIEKEALELFLECALKAVRGERYP